MLRHPRVKYSTPLWARFQRNHKFFILVHKKLQGTSLDFVVIKPHKKTPTISVFLFKFLE
jgi:hypothetical protein